MWERALYFDRHLYMKRHLSLISLCAWTAATCASVRAVMVCMRACGQGKYFEAICTDINPEERTLVACFPPEAGLDDTCFKVPYDMLILGAALPGKVHCGMRLLRVLHPQSVCGVLAVIISQRFL